MDDDEAKYVSDDEAKYVSDDEAKYVSHDDEAKYVSDVSHDARVSASSDTVSLHALALAVDIGRDHWDRQRAQPVLITLDAHTDLARAGRSDDVADTIHYGQLAHAVRALEQHVFPSLAHLALAAADVALAFPAVAHARVLAAAPKLLLQAASLAVELERGRASATPPTFALHINNLSLHAVIGVNPPERVHRQRVVTTVSFLGLPASDAPLPHRALANRLAQHIESSAYRTLEALATDLARLACFLDGMDTVAVEAHKPSAVSFARSSAVRLTRNRAFFRPSP